MENQQIKRPLDSISSPNGGGDEHISLSPPAGSSHSSGHISLSPPHGSNRNSPVRSSIELESDRASINLSHGSSPENENLQSPSRRPPPASTLRKDVFMEPKENLVVLEEPMAVVNRVVMEEPKAAAAAAKVKVKPDQSAVEGGDGKRRFKPSLSILKRAKREKMLKQAGLGFRVFGFLFCLVSLSVMAANRNQGWAIDSFYRYKEFRYCASVNGIGFVYSAAQAFDLSYNLATGKYIMHHQQPLRHYFDFALDQIIAYLLISASSSATFRVEDWQSNWGRDKFPEMATASVSVSFLAFFALASNSLISGYTLYMSSRS